jgi:hypothetical protein
MASLRTLLRLTLLPLLGACPGPSPGVCQQVGGAPPSSPLTSHIGLPGDEVTLHLRAVPFLRCEGEAEQVPETVRVTVVDGHNRPLPSRARLVRSGEARVYFRVEEPGAHHVIVIFEPRGGVRQLGLLVGEDRREAPSLVLPADCPQLGRTEAGTWLCGARVLRERVEQPPLPSGLVALQGNTVWAATDGGLQVLEDTGSGPLEPVAHVPLEEEVVELRTRGAWTLARTASSALHTVFRGPDGTLQQSPQEDALEMGLVRHLLLGDGVAYRLVSIDSSGSTEACAFALVPGAHPVPGDCQRLSGESVDIEEEGVWTRSEPTPDSAVLRYYRLEKGRLALAASMPLHANTGIAIPGDVGGSWHGSGLWTVPRPTGTDIVLERYAPRDSTTPGHASSTYAWTVEEGHRTRVWVR